MNDNTDNNCRRISFAREIEKDRKASDGRVTHRQQRRDRSLGFWKKNPRSTTRVFNPRQVQDKNRRVDNVEKNKRR